MVVELVGKCDGVDIVFKHLKNNTWVCDVPADLTDGVYIIELFAKSESGSIAYYTGKLYMCNSTMTKFEINEDKFDFTFLNDNLNLNFIDAITTAFLDDELQVIFDTQTIKEVVTC